MAAHNAANLPIPISPQDAVARRISDLLVENGLLRDKLKVMESTFIGIRTKLKGKEVKCDAEGITYVMSTTITLPHLPSVEAGTTGKSGVVLVQKQEPPVGQ